MGETQNQKKFFEHHLNQLFQVMKTLRMIVLLMIHLFRTVFLTGLLSFVHSLKWSFVPHTIQTVHPVFRTTLLLKRIPFFPNGIQFPWLQTGFKHFVVVTRFPTTLMTSYPFRNLQLLKIVLFQILL